MRSGWDDDGRGDDGGGGDGDHAAAVTIANLEFYWMIFVCVCVQLSM